MKKLIPLLSLAVSSSYVANAADEKTVVERLFNNIINSKVWNLDTAGIVQEPDAIDRLGEAVSHGDYNDDGYQDLAIGIPNYDFEFFGTINNVGTVLIIYGSPNGLTSNDSQLLFQTFVTDPPNLENSNGVEANDQFGKSLASGDFNCDGITDLAVGTPNESVTLAGDGGVPRNDVGAINIFYGSVDGFADLGAGSTFLLQGTGTGIFLDAIVSAGDRFGWSMAVGNFNGDVENGNFCHDLAVSAPFEDFGNMDQISDGGQVEVFYGKSSGISGDFDSRDSLSQQSDDIPESAVESNDQFGLSLAAGRFRGVSLLGPSFSDLAVGIPGEDIDGETNAGAVQVFNGASVGLDENGTSQIWSQSGAVAGVVEAHDRFGENLISGDFNADQFADLVVTAPREDLNAAGVNDAGVVHVIYGGFGGLNTGGNQIFHQNTAGIFGDAENSDRFGDSLASGGDLNYDFYPDLVVGIPRRNDSRGAFLVLLGGPDGITTTDSLYEPNFLASGEVLDEMAYAMTVADFGNGRELAVSLPGDDSSGGDNDAGSVIVYEFENPDVIFENDFES